MILCKSSHNPLAIRPASISESSEGSEPGIGPKDEAEYKKLLGNATWRLLHTLAARYPDEPTDLDKQRMGQFIDLLGYLYPCPSCRTHYRTMIADNPPQVQTLQLSN